MGRPRKEIRCRKDAKSGKMMVMFYEVPSWFMTPSFTEKQALDWARRNKARIIINARTETALSTHMERFFSPASPWVRLQRGKGRTLSNQYLAMRQGHVDNYPGPLFGNIDARQLGAGEIEKAIFELKGIRGKALAPATKYKIVDTLRIILGDLYIHGKIDHNPIENLLPYSKRPVAPRGAIPREAFPHTDEFLILPGGASPGGSVQAHTLTDRIPCRMAGQVLVKEFF